MLKCEWFTTKKVGLLTLIINIFSRASAMYLFIGVGPLCLRPRASLGGAVGAILLALTLLILRILGGAALTRTCDGKDTYNTSLYLFDCPQYCRLWIVLTISLWLSAVALLRGVLLLTEGLLLARALRILSLLLTVLRVTWRYICTGTYVSY